MSKTSVQKKNPTAPTPATAVAEPRPAAVKAKPAKSAAKLKAEALELANAAFLVAAPPPAATPTSKTSSLTARGVRSARRKERSRSTKGALPKRSGISQ